MIKVSHLLALSITAALAANVSAETVNSISFEGKVTQPTCVISMDKSAITLPTVATTAFKPDGDVKVAGAEEFTLSLVQTSENGGVENAFCPSVSYATDATGKTKPQLKISSDNVTTQGYLKNTADVRTEDKQTVAIQILQGTNALDLSQQVVIEGEDSQEAKLDFTARYVALGNTPVDVQTVTASLNVSVDYK